MDDVILNKVATIERCLKRIYEEYQEKEGELETNLTKQDSVIFNIQRACEAAIGVGMRVVRKKNLGIPQSSRDVFLLLEKAGLLEQSLSEKLQAMVGFRNIAVHDYQKMNIEIVRSILKNNLTDFKKFCTLMKEFIE